MSNMNEGIKISPEVGVTYETAAALVNDILQNIEITDLEISVLTRDSLKNKRYEPKRTVVFANGDFVSDSEVAAGSAQEFAAGWRDNYKATIEAIVGNTLIRMTYLSTEQRFPVQK